MKFISFLLFHLAFLLTKGLATSIDRNSQEKTFLGVSNGCESHHYYDPNSLKCQRCSSHCFSCTGKAFYECKICDVNAIHLSSGCVEAFSVRVKSIEIEPKKILEFESKFKEIFKPYVWVEIWDEDAENFNSSTARSVRCENYSVFLKLQRDR